MPESTGPTPEAEALARVIWPESGTIHWMVEQAQRAIDAGWTPPDTHEAIARDIAALIYPGEEFDPRHAEDGEWDFDAELLDAVRRLDLRRGTDG